MTGSGKGQLVVGRREVRVRGTWVKAWVALGQRRQGWTRMERVIADTEDPRQSILVRA